MSDKIIFLDVETGGLSPETDALLEIGAVFVEDNNIVGEYSQLIIPSDDLKIHETALRVNKLNIEDIHCTGRFEDEVLVDFLAEANKYNMVNAKIAGWNVSFDVEFLKNLFKRCSVIYPFSYRTLDVQSIWYFYNQTIVKSSYQSLSDVSNLLCGVKTEHRAFSDALATFNIYKHMLNNSQEDRVQKQRELYLKSFKNE